MKGGQAGRKEKEELQGEGDKVGYEGLGSNGKGGTGGGADVNIGLGTVFVQNLIYWRYETEEG